MPPARSRADIEGTDFTFDPDGDVKLILTSKKKPEPKEQVKKNMKNAGKAFPYPTPASAEPRIVMVVSSKHMTLASPVFKRMLAPGFKEGEELRSSGNVQIELPEDDPDALSVLMNIIHSRNGRVPRAITLELLTSIAILVDKYQIKEETIGHYADLWIERVLNLFFKTLANVAFKKALPNFIRLLSICWSFRNEGFEKISLIGAQLSDDDNQIRSHHNDMHDIIPLPEKVFVAIENLRQKLILELVGNMRSCVEPYYSEEGQCKCKSGKCDALILGCLLRHFSVKGISIYRLRSPYPALSVGFLDDQVSRIDLPKACYSSLPVVKFIRASFASAKDARKGIKVATLA